jgi:uncharacterized protein with GYD domain
VQKVWQKTGGLNGGKQQSNSLNRPVANWRRCIFAFGDTDVFAIVDFPDNVSAAAISLAGNGAGQANIKATVLITPEEMDQAAQKSQGLRPPGA